MAKRIVAYFEKIAYRNSSFVSVSNSFLYSLATKYGVNEERIIQLPHGFDPKMGNDKR